MLITKARHVREMIELSDNLLAIGAAKVEASEAQSRTKGRLAAEALAERDHARKALADIAAMETPNCAHIGKRMAARANDALGN